MICKDIAVGDRDLNIVRIDAEDRVVSAVDRRLQGQVRENDGDIVGIGAEDRIGIGSDGMTVAVDDNILLDDQSIAGAAGEVDVSAELDGAAALQTGLEVCGIVNGFDARLGRDQGIVRLLCRGERYGLDGVGLEFQCGAREDIALFEAGGIVDLVVLEYMELLL